MSKFRPRSSPRLASGRSVSLLPVLKIGGGGGERGVGGRGVGGVKLAMTEKVRGGVGYAGVRVCGVK